MRIQRDYDNYEDWYISIPDLLSMEFIYHVKEDKKSTNSYIHGQSLLVHKK